MDSPEWTRAVKLGSKSPKHLSQTSMTTFCDWQYAMNMERWEAELKRRKKEGILSKHKQDNEKKSGQQDGGREHKEPAANLDKVSLIPGPTQ